MSVKIGQRVVVRDKDVVGTVAYVGLTEFAPGKWIGLVLDEPKGKNDGSVQGKSYFNCPDRRGMFVRQTQIALQDDLDDQQQQQKSPLRSPVEAKKSPEGQQQGLKKAGIATAKSRLPTPGSGPTSGRSPSFTNLKSKGSSKDLQGSASQSSLQRERSFVETNFVETLKQPQMQVQVQTPLRAAHSSAAVQLMADRLEEKAANLANTQELGKCKEEIVDLKEKLDTMKLKRAKDQEKIKEYEKIRIQHEQLVEFKSRIMEAHGALQKELQKAKHEAKEALEAKEQHADEMAELSETVEMATLDKEMAEERAETLQLELEAAKEKVEELTLDLDIIKAEMGDDSSSSPVTTGTTNFEVKHLNAQNEKLKETLVRMRDLSAHEKSETLKLTKDLEEVKARSADLSKHNEKYASENELLENTISDLQEQVDAALGAEEMVENLTTKCLDLEDKLAIILEEKQDLEKLHEMDEELQENARELELELREDIDLAHSKAREVERSRDAAYEIVADHETTIKKFRDLVTQVQEQNVELRCQLEKETNKPIKASSSAAEMIDFKKMFAETKAHSKAIDMELRQCQVEQANNHVRLLSCYMSDSFTARGGDNEAVLVLLLVPRMSWKVSILVTQIKEKFVSSDLVIDKSTLLKGHAVERYTFGSHMLHKLHCLTAVLKQYETALNTCGTQTFLKIGTLHPEMAAHEKAVDFYIDLLRKDQLDENVPLDNMERCLHYFMQIYPLHLNEEKLDHGSYLADSLRAYSSAADCLTSLLNIGKTLMGCDSSSSEMGILFKTSEHDLNQLKATMKSMRRRLPQAKEGGVVSPTEPVINFPASVAEKLSDTLKQLSVLVTTMHMFAKAAAQQAGLQADPENGVPGGKLAELLNHAIDTVYELNNDNGLDTVRNSLAESVQTMAEFNTSLQDGEWDQQTGGGSNEIKPVIPPVVVRSETYKSELKEAEAIKYKLENKDMDIRDLKRLAKAKTEEMSEMQVRKDKAEKRLADANRDAELMREKLQRKLDDTQGLLKRKEKEFEETMDHLQKDLDSLESERGELKNKLKETTMKVLLDGIARGGGSSGGSPSLISGSSSVGPMSIGPSVPTPVKDSPMLLRQMQDLQQALLVLKDETYRRRGEDMRKRLAKMKPLTVPKRLVAPPASEDNSSPESEKKDASKEDVPTLDDLSKRVGDLRGRINSALVSADIVDISKAQKSQGPQGDVVPAFTPHTREVNKALRDRVLKRETDQLKIDIARLLAAKRPGGQVETDFCRFPTPLMSRAIDESEYTLVGRVNVSSDKQPLLKTVPLIIGPKDLQQIHNTVMA